MTGKDPLEPIIKLIDDVKTVAFQRGGKPDWSDVWVALCRSQEYAGVLRDKGVDVTSLSNDLKFLARFNGSHSVFGNNSTERKIEAVRRSLMDEIQKSLDFIELEFSGEKAKGAEEIIFEIQRRAAAMTSDKKEDQIIKMMLLQSLLGDVREMMAMDTGTDENIHEFARYLSVLTLKSMASETSDVAETLKTVLLRPGSLPSPVSTIEQIIGLTGRQMEPLLVRNGMLTHNTSVAEKVKDMLPSPDMITLALSAAGDAHEYKMPAIEPRLLVLPLLLNRDVILHLARLGITDTMEFRNKVEEILFKEELEKTDGARVYPAVDPAFTRMIWQMNAIEGDEDRRAPERLKLLMRAYPAIDKALNTAGLRRRMLKGWDAAYDVKDKKDTAKKEPKKKKDFEVPDHVLEDLIKEYCTDYTARASAGKFDPMIGNEHALEQVETTLLKRGKKNPIVIGEPGVGKSKILEGVAKRMVSGKAPAKLVGGRLLSLDLHNMDTTPYVGVFERRILPILKGVSERNASGRFPPILLGIDEFGSAQDAGATGGRSGAKELLKPYLTSGDLFVIANTTTKEYQQKVEKDTALARRFNVISLPAPTDEETADILVQLKPRYSRHHGIRIHNHFMRDIAMLAGRYVKNNQPDKSIDALDLACAIAAKANEKTLNRRHVIKAISQLSGIEEPFLSQTDNARYLNLEGDLNGDVVEQPEAVAAVSGAIRRAKAGFKQANSPIGNFLFIGPTGVGKTELTRALARRLFGGEGNMTRFNMSEFQEKHTAARFIGAPPGYVGFEEGGKLINALRAQPHGVLLYDEIEKAYPDVFDLLLAPFEDGIVTDGRGVEGSMKESLNIMTSNLGAKAVREEGARRGLDPIKDAEAWNKMARPIYNAAVNAFFKPEFINRLDGIIYFNTLSRGGIDFLVDRRIDATKQALAANYGGAKLVLTEEFREAIVDEGFDPLMGARPLGRAVKTMLETPLADFVLAAHPKDLAGKTVFADAGQDEAVLNAAIEALDLNGDIQAQLADASKHQVSFRIV